MAIRKLNRDSISVVFASVDWGFTNPGTIQTWVMDYDGRMYLIHEVYRSRRLIGWWTDKAVALRDRYGIGDFVCDPSEPAYLRQFREAGLSAREAINDIEIGIQKVQERLAVAPDGRPRLMVLRGCLEERDEILAEAKKPCSVAEEIDSYMWAKSKDGRPVKEEPLKLNDHGCDAMRYAVMAAERWYSGIESPKLREAREQAEFAAREAAYYSDDNEDLWR